MGSLLPIDPTVILSLGCLFVSNPIDSDPECDPIRRILRIFICSDTDPIILFLLGCATRDPSLPGDRKAGDFVKALEHSEKVRHRWCLGATDRS